MRYPLFADPKTSDVAGMPLNVLQTVGEVPIFDTSTKDEDVVWAITLYVWWHTNSAAPVNPPALIGRVYNDGEGVSTRAVTLLPAAFFTALSASQAPRFAPYKLLDRLCLRGEQILTLQNTVGANANCFVYGYAESVGESVLSKPYRPLQPQGNNLVSPFNGDPTTLLVADQDHETALIHKLTNTQLDYLSLNIATAATATSTAKLLLPDGKEMLMPFVTGVAQIPFYPVFDGIPMRAPSSSDVSITMDLAADGGKQAYMAAYGHFLRG